MGNSCTAGKHLDKLDATNDAAYTRASDQAHTSKKRGSKKTSWAWNKARKRKNGKGKLHSRVKSMEALNSQHLYEVQARAREIDAKERKRNSQVLQEETNNAIDGEQLVEIQLPANEEHLHEDKKELDKNVNKSTLTNETSSTSEERASLKESIRTTRMIFLGQQVNEIKSESEIKIGGNVLNLTEHEDITTTKELNENKTSDTTNFNESNLISSGSSTTSSSRHLTSTENVHCLLDDSKSIEKENNSEEATEIRQQVKEDKSERMNVSLETVSSQEENKSEVNEPPEETTQGMPANQEFSRAEHNASSSSDDISSRSDNDSSIDMTNDKTSLEDVTFTNISVEQREDRKNKISADERLSQSILEHTQALAQYLKSVESLSQNNDEKNTERNISFTTQISKTEKVIEKIEIIKRSSIIIDSSHQSTTKVKESVKKNISETNDISGQNIPQDNYKDKKLSEFLNEAQQKNDGDEIVSSSGESQQDKINEEVVLKRENSTQLSSQFSQHEKIDSSMDTSGEYNLETENISAKENENIMNDNYSERAEEILEKISGSGDRFSSSGVSSRDSQENFNGRLSFEKYSETAEKEEDEIKTIFTTNEETIENIVISGTKKIEGSTIDESFRSSKTSEAKAHEIEFEENRNTTEHNIILHEEVQLESNEKNIANEIIDVSAECKISEAVELSSEENSLQEFDSSESSEGEIDLAETEEINGNFPEVESTSESRENIFTELHESSTELKNERKEIEPRQYSKDIEEEDGDDHLQTKSLIEEKEETRLEHDNNINSSDEENSLPESLQHSYDVDTRENISLSETNTETIKPEVLAVSGDEVLHTMTSSSESDEKSSTTEISDEHDDLLSDVEEVTHATRSISEVHEENNVDNEVDQISTDVDAKILDNSSDDVNNSLQEHFISHDEFVNDVERLEETEESDEGVNAVITSESEEEVITTSKDDKEETLKNTSDYHEPPPCIIEKLSVLRVAENQEGNYSNESINMQEKTTRLQSNEVSSNKNYDSKKTYAEILSANLKIKEESMKVCEVSKKSKLTELSTKEGNIEPLSKKIVHETELSNEINPEDKQVKSCCEDSEKISEQNSLQDHVENNKAPESDDDATFDKVSQPQISLDPEHLKAEEPIDTMLNVEASIETKITTASYSENTDSKINTTVTERNDEVHTEPDAVTISQTDIKITSVLTTEQGMQHKQVVSEIVTVDRWSSEDSKVEVRSEENQDKTTPNNLGRKSYAEVVRVSFGSNNKK